MINADIDWVWVKDEVLRAEKISASSKDERSGNIMRTLDACMAKAKSLAVPKYSYLEKKISVIGNDFIELAAPVSFSTKKIPPYLSGATHVVLFVATIGDGIEKEASILTSGKDLLSGYLLDRIGSFAAESMAKNAEDALRHALAPGNSSVSMRFSPGYCDWRIEEQSRLAKIMDFSKIGVTLTGSFMMVPKKSISAIVGIGPKKLFSAVKSPCSLCNMKVCDYRRNS